jgi:hypothetical protein
MASNTWSTLLFFLGATTGKLYPLTINVLRLVTVDLVVTEFTVGGLGGTITTGQVVDDETENVLARKVGDGSVELSNVLDGIADRTVSLLHLYGQNGGLRNSQPQEATDVGNLLGRSSQGRVAEGLDSGVDLITEEAVGVQLVLRPYVGARVKLDGRCASSSRLGRSLL